MAPSKHSSDSVSRQERKAKKRKLEDAVPDLPGDNDNDNEDGGASLSGVTSQPEERVSKKARKEEKKKKFKKQEISGGGDVEGKSIDKEDGDVEKGEVQDDVEGAAKVNLLGEVEAPRKSKKERKAERKAKDAAAKAAGISTAEEGEIPSATVPTTIDASVTDSGKKQSKSVDQSAQQNGEARAKNKNNNRNRDRKRAEKAAQRAANGGYEAKFIIFVGNLPYTATTESISKHFGSVKPKSIRHLTKKEDPTKSRGCAFVEFDDHTQMETALRLFHHSIFNDGLSPGRKINVELTAGGGGNTQKRRSKIEQKNSKLTEERQRKIQEEEKAKWAKKKEGGGGEDADVSGVHPSRRGRVPGQQ